MKTGVISSPTIASDDLQGSAMGMSVKGMDIAAYFLRDKIYSDKILACVREYTSNAVDEHKKHKIDQPVIVKIEETETNVYYWSVRDYALGLDEYGIRNIFGMYFESTKGHDNSSIGGFGIGAKAGLSYTDTFYVISYHNGKKTTYACVLGGSDTGIPKGQIYSVSEEDTDETGLEIRIQVDTTTYDLGSFHNHSVNFVRCFTNDIKIEYHRNHQPFPEIFTPMIPKFSEKFGVVTIHGYEEFHHLKYDNYYDDNVIIRMGGVVYSTHKCSTLVSPKRLVNIVVDVPIGFLTIPISREEIENTPANKRALEDIEKMVRSIQLKDTKEIGVPKIIDILDKKVNAGYNSLMDGKWFRHSVRNSFPDSCAMAQWIARTTYDDIPRSPNGKHVVYLIPKNRSSNTWVTRLENELRKNIPDYKGCFYAQNVPEFIDYTLGKSKEIVLDDLVFVDVKKLKLPKLQSEPKDDTPKEEREYVVYRYNSRLGSFTPQGLVDYIENNSKIKVDLEDDWWEDIKNFDLLYERTVDKVGNKRTKHVSYHVVSSDIMFQELKKLGWLTPQCQEYKDTYSRIFDAKREAERIESIVTDVSRQYFPVEVLPQIISSIKKSPDKIKKLANVKKKLMEENSLRGRILKKLFTPKSYYSIQPDLNREELRAILKIK